MNFVRAFELHEHTELPIDARIQAYTKDICHMVFEMWDIVCYIFWETNIRSSRRRKNRRFEGMYSAIVRPFLAQVV